MSADYKLHDTNAVPTPALLFYPKLIQANLLRMIEIAGSPVRLRPHAKTHKCAEITRMELALGITKHKCATLREAQMLAECGAPDVLIAYPMLEHQAVHLKTLCYQYPETRFAVLADNFKALNLLINALQFALPQLPQHTFQSPPTLEVFLDVNVGQDRTGVAPGAELFRLCDLLFNSEGMVQFGGFHVYDGHNYHPANSERTNIAQNVHELIRRLRNECRLRHWPESRVVIGGTPAFLLHAQLDLPNIELSPGTCVLHDWNYSRDYPELGFTPAGILLTRCVSRPTPNRVTFDLGTKAVCADPPAGKRCIVLGLEKAVAVAHNEEHLVLETPEADQWYPGKVAYAIPAHVCPTIAHYRRAQVVSDGHIIDAWDITARDRDLCI